MRPRIMDGKDWERPRGQSPGGRGGMHAAQLGGRRESTSTDIHDRAWHFANHPQCWNPWRSNARVPVGLAVGLALAAAARRLRGRVRPVAADPGPPRRHLHLLRARTFPDSAQQTSRGSRRLSKLLHNPRDRARSIIGSSYTSWPTSSLRCRSSWRRSSSWPCSAGRLSIRLRHDSWPRRCSESESSRCSDATRVSRRFAPC